MRWLLIGLISAYQLMPNSWKRKCVFKETCSQYVKRVARENGARAATRVLVDRWHKCRPVTAYFSPLDGETEGTVQLADGTLVAESELAANAYIAYKLSLSAYKLDP